MAGFVPALAVGIGGLTPALETISVASITDSDFGEDADCGSEKSDKESEEVSHVCELERLN